MTSPRTCRGLVFLFAALIVSPLNLQAADASASMTPEERAHLVKLLKGSQALGGHPKTGQRWTSQNRPTEPTRDSGCFTLLHNSNARPSIVM
jgi:hypothetical protein